MSWLAISSYGKEEFHDYTVTPQNTSTVIETAIKFIYPSLVDFYSASTVLVNLRVGYQEVCSHNRNCAHVDPNQVDDPLPFITMYTSATIF